jgi:hypothetical protein
MAIIEFRTNNKGTIIPVDGYASCCGLRPQVRVYTTTRSKHIDMAVFCENPECDLHGSGVSGYPEEFPVRWNRAVLDKVTKANGS